MLVVDVFMCSLGRHTLVEGRCSLRPAALLFFSPPTRPTIEQSASHRTTRAAASLPLAPQLATPSLGLACPTTRSRHGVGIARSRRLSALRLPGRRCTGRPTQCRRASGDATASAVTHSEPRRGAGGDHQTGMDQQTRRSEGRKKKLVRDHTRAFVTQPAAGLPVHAAVHACVGVVGLYERARVHSDRFVSAERSLSRPVTGTPLCMRAVIGWPASVLACTIVPEGARRLAVHQRPCTRRIRVDGQ